MRIIFLGGPGSGKSTVGKRMAEELGWQWVSVGAILRESTEEWIQERLKTAELFDDDMVTEIVMTRLMSSPNVIIDAYPRSMRQAELVIEKNMDIDLIVEMEVPMEETVTRLLARGRGQDTRETIETRWQMYKETEEKIVAYLMGNGIPMVKIDGVGEVDEVYARATKQILTAVKEGHGLGAEGAK